MSKIGTLNEKPLHAALKQWYAQPGDLFEVPTDGFVIDIVRGDLLIEIQTRSLSSIKRKLNKLAKSHQIMLVYPITQEKWIVKPATDGSDKASRRKSPKRGRWEDMFWELVGFGPVLSEQNISLEVLMIKEEEVRRYEENKHWRRHGWATEERRLIEVVDHRTFDKPTDYLSFIPDELESFTAKELAEAIDVRPQLAQRMTYLLRKMHVIELVGRKGRAYLYEVNQSPR